jgi:aryl-alcohol dehydrogenase-like predicted oxidoreductase
MERRRLGRLGHHSSVVVFGGAMLSDSTQEEADRAVEVALGAGVNHFDTAAGYGRSERLLGPWIPRIRDGIFLASKTGDRTAEGAYRSIRRSLEHLRTDRLDLIQLHAVCDTDDLDRATRSGGALDGAVRARDEGLVGGVGITGHGMRAPAVHLEALRRFPFDTVLTPYSYALTRYPAYGRDFEALVEEVVAQDAGLLLIKAVARNLWRSSEPRSHTTWYEPLTVDGDVDAAVTFALARPEATGICSPGDVSLLPAVIGAERRRAGLAMDEVVARLEAVAGYAPPFVRTPGREVPDWLEPVVDAG